MAYEIKIYITKEHQNLLHNVFYRSRVNKTQYFMKESEMSELFYCLVTAIWKLAKSHTY